jgi:hypothetical protein
MTDFKDGPDGCLSCNKEEVGAYLLKNGVSPHQVEQVPAQFATSSTMPPCPKCGSVFRVKHSIDEDWQWLVRKKIDGSNEIFGVMYPNGDRKLAVEMPFQQWKAYLKKGHLKIDGPSGNLSVKRPDRD